MRHQRWMVFSIVCSLAIFALSCSDGERSEVDQSGTPRVPRIQDGFHGWDSLVLRNQYVRLDVVPELGGKIMGFGLHGFQVLWHDKTREGDVATDQGYGFGESFFNPGGAKVWPAPQGWSGEGEWPGPPDNVLDSASYEFDVNDNTITVTSPRDDGPGRTGLQFINAYTVPRSASVAELDLSMKNVVDRTVKWSLWHLATLPVDRACTVYVPADEGDWHVIFGDENNPQWLGAENGLFRARYDGRVGKIGIRAREGWAAWHDEENDIVFAMVFPVEKGKEYPDGGSNVEIWTAGAGTIRANNQDVTYEHSPETAMMELEVLGPLTSLSPGASASFPVLWGVTRCSGITRVTPSCVVVDELTFDEETGVQGKFGVFYGGDLQSVYLDENGTVISHTTITSVSPINEVIIDQGPQHIITRRAKTIRYQVRSIDKQSVHVLGEVNLR